MYAPADGDGQNPTDIHCNAGTYPTYVDTGATSVTVNGLNYTILTVLTWIPPRISAMTRV